MLGTTLVTVGLVLDIIGVALLLAGPRVHVRTDAISFAEQSDDPSALRRWWSRWGWLGLPIVSSGFTLQILGAWSDQIETLYLVALGAILIPAVFGGSWWLVHQLPQGD